MVEKMKLVRVQGTLPQLNDFLDACCMDGRFDLEPATRYMSDSLGYAALNEENPYPATRDQIETMAKEAGMELHKEQRHTDPPDEEAKAYLSDLLEQIDDLCAERQGLLDQQKLCEDGIAQYSHFLNLKVNVDEILDCQHVKVRFGFLPTEGYNKLMSNYADDPYILFVECTQTKTGYWGISLPRSSSILKRTWKLSKSRWMMSTPASRLYGMTTKPRCRCCTTRCATTPLCTTCAAWLP